ncbi:MAG: DUF1697 domain-containing protein [Armatimonadetes bacterium]|nr:DUF1697 domain-containing protein [Armatimonadota bacterium]
MPEYAVFLRSLNVGTTNRIKSADLCDVFRSVGTRDVRTFLQSGNVRFQHDDTDVETVAQLVERGLEEAGLKRVAAIVRTLEDLDGLAAGKPFGSGDGAGLSRFVVLLRRPYTGDFSGLKSPDCTFVGSTPTEVFLTAPKGLPRPANPNATIEKVTGSPCTGRFWNVVVDFAAFCRKG